jgi:glycosyltransferase involved in cell wall biosynthesis
VRVVLYNHTGLVSGAERSLLELAAGLRDGPGDYAPLVAAPKGPIHALMGAAGIETATVRGTSASFRMSPAGLPKAGAGLAAAARDVARLCSRERAGILHANSARAGLIGLGARALGGPPVVVHLRDVLPPGRAGDAVARAILRARAVVAISEHVADRLRRVGRSSRLHVIHNAVDLARFGEETDDVAQTRSALGVPAAGPVLGVFAQITKWKGQDVAVEALAGVRAAHPDATLLIVGEAKFVARETRYDNPAFERALRARAAELGEGAVHFLGERSDIPALMRACDLILVPSWEEPFGRAVVEAMAVGRPVLATAIGGPAEILTHGTDGLLLDPRDVPAWTREALALLADRDRAATIGLAARERAQAFSRAAHAAAVSALYVGRA